MPDRADEGKKINHILIYQDAGVSPESYQETAACFSRLGYSVATASSGTLNNTSWEESTTLLIIPGGRADPYHDALYPNGYKKILDFIKSGGSYLGICAGGYYGASKIIFEKGNPAYEIINTNTLNLYPGIAEGPAYDLGVFRYNSEEGARVASVMADNITFPTYFNGGCFFHSHQDNPNIKILAQYADIPHQPAAIIFCDYGKGRVCLSGVHLEYALKDNHQINRDNCLDKILKYLMHLAVNII